MVSIRRYRIGDGPETHRVFYDAVRIGAADHYSQLEREAWAASDTMPASWDARFMAQNCQVAEVSDRIVGFMSLTDTGHIDMAFVLPQMMGTGVAGKLYDRLELAARNGEFAQLTTDASHLAKSFFKRRGWDVTAAQVKQINGQDLHSFAMKKKF